MIEFATLILSLVVGPQRIDLSVGESVASVEILLDGEYLSTVYGPPWSFRCEFGEELLPHELLAIAYDQDEVELARTRQLVNLPRPRAEVRLTLEESARGPPVVRLIWSALDHERPRKVEVAFDGMPLPVGDIERIPLPRHDPKTLHFVRAELDFSDTVQATAELVFGGTYTDEVSTELTPYPVLWKRSRLPKVAAMQGWFQSGGVALRVVAVERRPAEVVFIREKAENNFASLRGLVKIRQSRVGLPIPIPKGLEPGDRARFVFPSEVVEVGRDSTLRMIPVSHNVAGFGDGSMFQLLTVAFFDGQDIPLPRQRLVDSVAIAGLTATEASRPRAVVLIRSGESEDGSEHGIEQVRGYLRSLGVPLFVWTVWNDPENPSPSPWPEDRDISKLSGFGRAIGDLRQHLDRQVMVWLADFHLPNRIEISTKAEGMESLWASRPPVATASDALREDLDRHGSPDRIPDPTAEGAEAELRVGESQGEGESSVLGAAAEWTLASRARIQIEEGSQLRAEANSEGEKLGSLPALTTIALETQGSWARVRVGELEGWVDLAAEPPPTFESGVAGGGDARPGSAHKLEISGMASRARQALTKILGTLERDEAFGTFLLRTDTARQSLVNRLRAVAESLPGVYEERYGLAGEPSTDTVFLFGARRDYRAFRKERGIDIQFDAAGHAEPGFVALSAGSRSRQEVATTLAHELTHLLNWQRLGTDLPTWLDEGLADDMVLSKLDRKGGLLADPGLDWRNLRFGRDVGAVLNEVALAIDRGEAPTLPQLFSMGRDSFFADRQLSYALSSLWIRYLLSDTSPGHAQAFRAFLRAGSRGGSLDAEALRKSLGGEWPRLAGGFRRWLGQGIRRLGVPVDRVQ